MKHALSVLFRRRALVCVTFAAVLLATALLIVFRRPTYEAEMKFLVTGERADPVISGNAESRVVQSAEVSEAEVNSEIELLTSLPLYHDVVVRCRLYEAGRAKDQAAAVERAIQQLRANLSITPVRKAKIIRVVYSAPNPEQTVAVLRAVSDLYLESHVRTHRAPGAYEFFRAEAQRYHAQLRDAEARLNGFQGSRQVTLIGQQKEIAIRNLAEMRRAAEENGATLAETESRIGDLRRQLATADPRIVTQKRVTSNQYSVERLNTLVAELQNRRAELLTRFQPGDRLVQEVDEKLRNTTAALERAQQLTGLEQATDVNPVVTSLQSELSKNEFTRAGLASRRQVLEAQLSSHLGRINELNRLTAEHDELDRTVKEAEANYLLYARKEEEARIADSLDQRKVANVAVAEAPLTPRFPREKPLATTVVGLLLGCFLSVGAAFALENAAGRYYSPAEIEAATGLRVLATTPLEIG